MACLRSLLLSAAIAATAAWRRSSTKSSKAFLAGEAELQPDVVANSFASLADKWRLQARVFAECNASSDSSVVSDAASLAPCSSGPRAFERSCSTVAGAVLRASDGEPAVVREYMDEVCVEPKLSGWKSAGCRGFSKAILDAMSADVLSNRERLSAKAVCHDFWLKFLAQESELFEQERNQREAESRQKEAKRAEAMKKAADEAAKRAEEASKAEEELRGREEAARREAEKKRAAEEEASRQMAKEAKAASTKQLMEEARALANVSASADRVPENVSSSSPQEVLAASAEALTANGPAPTQGQTAPAAVDTAGDASSGAAVPSNSTAAAAAGQEQAVSTAANATGGPSGNATNQEPVALAAASATDGLPGNVTGQERAAPAVDHTTDGPSGNVMSAGAANSSSTDPGAAAANKTKTG